MTIPLSVLGLDKQDVEMLSNRLFPEVNKIFMERLAERNGYATQDITPLDYQNNPTYKMQKWLSNRQQLADHYFDQVKKGQRDPNEMNYKYKTIEEAKEAEPGKHVLMEGDSISIEELNEKIDALIIEKEKKKEDLTYPFPNQEDEKENI